MTRAMALKEVQKIESDIDKHSRLVRIGITLDQVRDRVTTLQSELEDLYEQARELEIESNEITGKVVA